MTYNTSIEGIYSGNNKTSGVDVETEEQDIEVDYSYSPGEDPVYYYRDGSGNPGSGPEVYINKIIWSKTKDDKTTEIDVTDLLSEIPDLLYLLEERILEYKQE